jgi:hypothetical protein
MIDSRPFVRFAVRIGPDQFAVEPAGPTVELDSDDQYGRLLFGAADQVTAIVEDGVISLIGGPCFQAVTQLAAGADFISWTERYPGEINFSRTSGGIQLEGSVLDGAGAPGPAVVLPADELITGLYACGRRALDFLHAQLDSDPAQTAALAGLEDLAAEARAALVDRSTADGSEG